MDIMAKFKFISYRAECLSENFLTREMQRKKGVAFATPKHTHIKRKISINYQVVGPLSACFLTQKNKNAAITITTKIVTKERMPTGDLNNSPISSMRCSRIFCGSG